MSENELDEILKEVRKKANSNMPVEPPSRSSNGRLHRVSDTPEIPKNPAANFDSSYFDLNAIENNNNYAQNERRSDRMKNKKKKKGLKPWVVAVIAVVLLIAAGAGIYFGFFNNKDKETQDPPKQTVGAEVEQVLNPLTGESGYDKAALGKRPVAVVVENEYSTEAVRPQWGISDADIVLEGESEFSTRLLLFWADYSKVPDMVGPARSARPPFIRFSQLFDSVFIHAGLSQSKGSYVGADTVFQSEDVDHINLLDLTEDGTYFGRNNDRNTAVEHRGFLNGINLPQLIEEKGIRTDLDETGFTSFTFNSEAKPVGDLTATSCEFKWSSGYCPKTAEFSYDAASRKYTTTDFDSQYGESGVKFENLIFLFDETQYVVKENYGGSGSSETYCDYKLSGGSGTILSEGTAVEISWGVSNGKLWLKTSDGKDVALNPGKIYIGYGSSNNGGVLALNPVSDAVSE